MSEPRYQMTLHSLEREQVTLDTLAASANVHPSTVECFVEFGLLEPVEMTGTQILFNADCIARLRAIVRLRRDLGANLAGIAVILDLRDRLTALQRENAWLRSRR